MSHYEPWMVRNTLRHLHGQPCTPPGTDRGLVRYVQDEGMARFREWPSGHWQITEKGSNFIADYAWND